MFIKINYVCMVLVHVIYVQLKNCVVGFDPKTSNTYTKVLTTRLSCIYCYYHKVLY